MNYIPQAPQHSRNDVQDVRATDIQVSVLVEELRQLNSSPWRSGVLVTDPNAQATEQDMRPQPGTATDAMSLMAWALAGLRTQCVTINTRRNNSASGEVRYVSMGHVQFRVDASEEERVFAKLQWSVAGTLSDRVVAACDAITRIMDKSEAPASDAQMMVVWCGGTFVLTQDRADASALARALNDSFRDATAPVREKVSRQLRDTLAVVRASVR